MRGKARRKAEERAPLTTPASIWELLGMCRAAAVDPEARSEGYGLAGLPLQRDAWRFYKLLLPIALLGPILTCVMMLLVLPHYVADVIRVIDTVVESVLTSPFLCIMLIAVPAVAGLVMNVLNIGALLLRLHRGLQPAPLPPSLACCELLHVVVIPAYKEPLEVLHRTLDSLASQTVTRERVVILLALEDADRGASATFEHLRQRYKGTFAGFWGTVHTLQPHEEAGKASNVNTAVRLLYESIVVDGIDPEAVMMTVCDADSTFAPRFLEHLECAFHRQPDGKDFLYDSPLNTPLNTWGNFLDKPFNWIVLHHELKRCLAHTSTMFLGRAPCYSNYSLTLALAHKMDYWTVDNVPEDIHTYNKVSLINRAALPTVPVYSLIVNDLVPGMSDRFVQAKRHSWGITEVPWLMAIYGHPKVEFRTWLGLLLQSLSTEIMAASLPVNITLFFPVTWQIVLGIAPLARYFLLAVMIYAFVLSAVAENILLFFVWYVLLRDHPTIRKPRVLTLDLQPEGPSLAGHLGDWSRVTKGASGNRDVLCVTRFGVWGDAKSYTVFVFGRCLTHAPARPALLSNRVQVPRILEAHSMNSDL
ncbi:hypothetical protein EMIHUDRAFT_247198 [Emiliania huxleyi CCMP1516]|uniref:Glycosyltransferase 2-like domain-containing protein n=2 Tax=Emiliania huxleyi TaxID=2903 RepID=A0A0D3IP05_EMIH1|nr:hypothetical protein EMIHUDRAFT_247198 [Emiliania huxleyi CCMP1516]EOD12990.1 hypothetical protein EMIHUDRAFT_247198 [Emiliania huxleyi CCMP1516]|eukprot:XP_005765419.1 hypothetical protein EMIHUDRAFT_247198 [Emiliania huxleyi CCMP1516]